VPRILESSPGSTRLTALRLLATSAALAGVTACSGSHDSTPAGPAPQVLTRLVISLPSDTIQVGETYSATATGFDQAGKPMTVDVPAWSTDLPAVASVNASGIVTGVGPGLTTLNARIGAKQGYTALTVIPVPVARVSLTPAAPTVNIGLTLQLSVALLDGNGNTLTGRAVAWTSSDSSKATVSATGLVTAFAAGAVTITATCEGIAAQVVITVPQRPVGVASVALTPPLASLLVGRTLQLVVALKDSSGNSLPGRSVVWTSSAPDVATVSSTGLVAALGPGTTTITATADAASATATIAVDNDLAIAIAKPDSVKPVGDTVHVWATIGTLHGLVTVVATVTPAVGYYDTPLVATDVGKIVPQIAWLGQIVIHDLKTGDYQLVVSVTDSTGRDAAQSVTFHHHYGHEGGGTPPPGRKQFVPPPPRRIP
jgi:uncharacterized protein YjdB